MFLITTFYKIFDLKPVEAEILQRKIRKFMQENEIKGTVLIGTGEGINATVAGTADAIKAFYEFARHTNNMDEIEYKESYHASNPFDKIKVKLRKEIVTMCKTSFSFTGEKGKYIKPENWDEFISRPDVVLLDTRNDYEYHIGTFDGAINPNIQNFRDLPAWLQENRHLYEGKKLATFCTGGIRCEKLTAYLVQCVHPETYHLETGILGYFASTGNKNGKWIGSCFVFDNRIAVNDRLEAI